MSKCSFGQRKIEYLGHIVSEKGVEMDGRKIQAIRQWPSPKNVTQLKGFLGLSGYYRRFIKGYANIADPLTRLLAKDAFKWDDQAQSAFERLKDVLTEAPILTLQDFSKSFILETDAFGVGIGAVLS
ncbi:uncharacterized protein LOC114744523 [Neltuma alba]|uniref:uncharacterized protein LOC114744523 n=1 Tax=Neltuma alba TaxID=207710 RepID=UPI0010A2B2A3|nr:uncharacterized protein LOC114744523 [Prosopis alba]